MEKKRVFGLFLICLILFSMFLFFVSAQTDSEAAREETDRALKLQARSEAADKFYDDVAKFISQDGIKQIVGVVFGIWSPDILFDLSDSFLGIKDFGLTKIAALIIYFVSWLLFLVIFKDILEIASPFSKGVNWLVALGLVIIASQLGAIRAISIRASVISAGLGAISVWILVLVLLGSFFLLLFGNLWLMKLAIRLRIVRDINRSEQSAGEVRGAIEGLREIEKEFKKR